MELLQLLSLLMGLLATALSGAKGRLVEQSPPYFMVRPEVSQSVTCTLKNPTYLWMSWYQQDAQGHLHFLVQSGTKGNQEKIIQEGTSYRSERVSSTELRLEMQNVIQSQTIYCTCSKGTVRD
ncbi:T-cell receptor beta chain V region E1 [Platysternon megacephalum]|nr:T-cell receptor beta chain V region E1 [Platysternon megacephalum]